MTTFMPLADRARLLFYLQSYARLLFVWVPLTMVGGALLAAFQGPITALAIAGGVLLARFLLATWWPWLVWRRWGWLHRDDEVMIARGVLIRSITAIPVERIQHVDVRQGPIEQWLGLARIHIHTASGLGADGVVPGLLRPQAEALRDALISAAAQGDDGV